MNHIEISNAKYAIAEIIQSLIDQDDEDVWSDVYDNCEGFIEEMLERHKDKSQ